MEYVSEGSLDPQPFAMEALISEPRFYPNLKVYPPVLVSLSLISRAQATLSKTSLQPSHSESSESPKLS
jgi:hypothetical protein